MKPLFVCLCVALSTCVATATAANENSMATSNSTSSASSSLSRKDVSEEMASINKSLEGLLSELATIKREASGRLGQVKNRLATTNNAPVDPERIRQQKVSRFVLKRVAELESESLGMRDEMIKLFELQRKTLSISGRLRGVEAKQEDVEFDNAEQQPASSAASPATTTSMSSASTTTTAATTTAEAEAAQIGFDLEQLKRLGAELESEIEARQAQGSESLRGVHEQVIKMVDNMVNNYLGNMRRAVQRFTNFIDNRRNPTQQQQQQVGPRSSVEESRVHHLGETIVAQLTDMTKSFREFTLQWSKTLDKQHSSPLFDRIPPRGAELWRDFWDTMRKQVRRINEEFWQVSRDMTRMLTGRLPSTGSRIIIRPREGEQPPSPANEQPPTGASLLYANNVVADSQQQQEQQIRQEFQEFYDKLTSQLRREQQRMSELGKAAGNSAQQQKQQQIETSQLIDELDDEATRQELANNVALRQQIAQEISVFGSIFDIMREFIRRLRDSATTIRDVLTPPGAIHSNDPVTPGPSVKPTVDKLLEDTINSQRNINSQARPATTRD